MKYIKLFEDYSETGENPSEVTIRVTEQFVKEFKLALNPVLQKVDMSVSALPGKSGVTLTKGQLKFIGFTPKHEDWFKDNSRSGDVPASATYDRVSNKVNIDHVFWFAKYVPEIGEVFLEGVHMVADQRKIVDFLDKIDRSNRFGDLDVSHLFKFGEGNNDFKKYRSLNCDFREFEEGSVDNDGYVELVSLK